MRLLAWGYVDNAWTADEFADLADRFSRPQVRRDRHRLAGGLLRELTSRALLLTVDGGLGESFRTRMAETVRLVARLRQLFPKHRDGAWTQAATLVSDFRIVSRPRAYPKRDIQVDDAIAEIAGTTSDGVREAAMRALLSGRASGAFELSRFQLEAAVDVLRGLGSGASGGTIIGAGTGSGKTLAFYLPRTDSRRLGKCWRRNTDIGDLSANRTPARSVRRGVSRGPAPRWGGAPRSANPAGRPLRRNTPPAPRGGTTLAGQGSRSNMPVHAVPGVWGGRAPLGAAGHRGSNPSAALRQVLYVRGSRTHQPHARSDARGATGRSLYDDRDA